MIIAKIRQSNVKQNLTIVYNWCVVKTKHISYLWCDQRGRADPRRGFLHDLAKQQNHEWKWPIGVLLYPPSNQKRDICRVCLTTAPENSRQWKWPIGVLLYQLSNQMTRTRTCKDDRGPPGWGRQKHWEKESFSASALVSHLGLFWQNGSSYQKKTQTYSKYFGHTCKFKTGVHSASPKMIMVIDQWLIKNYMTYQNVE